MNNHDSAGRTLSGRQLLVERICRNGLMPAASAKRMHARLKAIREPLMRHMREPIPVIGRQLRCMVPGYFHYRAVQGNVDRWDVLRKDVSRARLHALRR